jgi:hypothetical protein
MPASAAGPCSDADCYFHSFANHRVWLAVLLFGLAQLMQKGLGSQARWERPNWSSLAS